jgi:hypothetical protein
MTQTWQHEIYLPHSHYTLAEWANNLHVVPLSWRRWMEWWWYHCRSPSYNEPWTEKIDSPVESPNCVDALFGQSANTRVLQRGWPVNHTLARSHGLSLIDVECNIMFQGKPECPIFQTGWSGFGRFSLRRQRVPTTEIGPTSTQAAYGQGKARTVANLGASRGGDGWEKEDEFKVEGKLH